VFQVKEEQRNQKGEAEDI